LAGESNRICGQTAGELPLSIQSDNHTVILRHGAGVVFEYQRTPNPRKPYLRTLTTPAGINILRDAPVDHLHHHGLMFAVAVDGVTFWAESPEAGYQLDAGTVHAVLTANRENGKFRAEARLQQRLEWRNADRSQILILEDRELSWHALTSEDLPSDVGDFRLVLWKSQLELPAGKSQAVLSGSPYYGLGIRFIEQMDKTGQFFNAEGQTGVEGTNGKRSAWCAYRVEMAGKTITVAMLSHPDNLRHPATWFTMVQPFAYLSATLGLASEPFTLESGKPVSLSYGLVLWDTSPSAAAIQAVYEKVFCPLAPAKR